VAKKNHYRDVAMLICLVQRGWGLLFLSCILEGAMLNPPVINVKGDDN
jgi:hypothetical protein